MRAQDCACMRLQKAAYAGWFLCAHSEGFLNLIFPKIDLFAHKSYIFHFNISQVNLTYKWALNQSWVLEFSIVGEWEPEL